MNGVQSNNPHSPRLLLGIGFAWLLLATAILLYQLNGPVSVQVEWETETELETAGFFLYRSSQPDGEFVLVNSEMIPSQGSTVSGAVYTFEDTAVEAGQTYYYLLEEVELDSSTNRYENDILPYTVPGITWWATVLVVVSVLVGLALIITGLKEERQ